MATLARRRPYTVSSIGRPTLPYGRVKRCGPSHCRLGCYDRRKATHLGRHCSLPLAESYIGDSATDAGSAAEAAATRKAAKYAGLERTHIFQPVAVENLGTMNASAYGFLAGLGQKISAISGDDREACYLFQRISVLIQRFNATLLHESFADENRSDD